MRISLRMSALRHWIVRQRRKRSRPENEWRKNDHPGDRRRGACRFLRAGRDQNQWNEYLLVTDSEEDDEEGECYILKDQSKAEDADALYEFVEDDEEMDYLYKIFAELMDDMDVDLEK